MRAGAPAETVVLVSFDGMRWDAPGRADAPNLARMAREGVSASLGLVPPFPASTFPAHATLATGSYPDRHGIMNNEFLDSERGLFIRGDDASWLLSEPLWATAERQGIRAAVYHWVCSKTPWRGVAASIRVPFEAGTTDGEAIDQVIRWLRATGPDRPRLILAYLHGPDAAGHRDGPASRAVLGQVVRCDRLVARLLAESGRLARPITLLVVSDHGMREVTRPLDLRRLLARAAPGARAIGSGGTSNIYCARPAACRTAQALLARLPGLTLYTRERLPPDLHYGLPSRAGDLVAIASPGTYFAETEAPRGPPPRGMHGYRPDDAEMRGIFYAWGAGIRKGIRVDTLRMIDIDPLVCRLLQIEPPAGIDGRSPEDLLVRPAAGLPPTPRSDPGFHPAPPSAGDGPP